MLIIPRSVSEGTGCDRARPSLSLRVTTDSEKCGLGSRQTRSSKNAAKSQLASSCDCNCIISTVTISVWSGGHLQCVEHWMEMIAQFRRGVKELPQREVHIHVLLLTLAQPINRWLTTEARSLARRPESTESLAMQPSIVTRCAQQLFDRLESVFRQEVDERSGERTARRQGISEEIRSRYPLGVRNGVVAMIRSTTQYGNRPLQSPKVVGEYPFGYLGTSDKLGVLQAPGQGRVSGRRRV